MESYLTSGQVAKQLRVSLSTLKRWIDDPHLNIEERRNQNGWRLFSAAEVDQLKEFKRRIKRSGRQFGESTLRPIASLSARTQLAVAAQQ